jgi:hypothetical protein
MLPSKHVGPVITTVFGTNISSKSLPQFCPIGTQIHHHSERVKFLFLSADEGMVRQYCNKEAGEST